MPELAYNHVYITTPLDKGGAMLTPDEIRALREYTEMTHVQMAQLFRVRPADVIAWENGTLEPDVDQMVQLERLRLSRAKKMRFKFN
jgi:DNA-binding transcriptional regulator YiaG